MRVVLGVIGTFLFEELSGKVVGVPPCHYKELLAEVMQSGMSDGLVPIRNAFAYGGRPSAFGVLIEVVHNEDIHGFASEGASYAKGLEASGESYTLTFVGTAYPRTLRGRGIVC